METESKPIVFLDRDGTINIDSGYVVNPDDLQLISGASAAIAKFRASGFLVIVISNQSAIGRGFATDIDIQKTNQRLQELLSAENENAVIDMWCYAPDHPENASDRRKPGVGMLEDVRQAYEFVASECWMIGDKRSDVEFGLAAGLSPSKCILLGDSTTTKVGDCPIFESLAVVAAEFFN